MNKKQTDRIITISLTVLLTAMNIYSICDLLLQEQPAKALILSVFAAGMNYIFTKLIIIEHAELKKKSQVILLLVSLFIFSSLMMKSVLIYLYPLGKGITTIIYGIGWTLFGMGITYLVRYIMLKITWQPNNQQSKFKIHVYLFYCIPSLIIFSALLAIYFPGLGSADTVYIWDLIQNNQYNDLHPLMFMLLYKFISLIWNNIAAVMVFQILLCSLTFGYVSYYFSQKGLKKAYCIAASILLPLIPANAIYSVTLWKDVPYTMGLILFTIMIIKILEDNYFDKTLNILKFILVALFTLFMRHNGIICIFGAIGLTGFFFLTKKNYKMVIKFAAAFVITVVSFFGIKKFAASLLGSNYVNSTMLSVNVPITIESMQMIYIEHYYGDTFTPEQRKQFDKFFNAKGLAEQKQDWGQWNGHGWHWMFYHKPLTLNGDVITQNLDEFWDLYFDLVREHPVAALEEYQKITGIIWASPDYGPTAYRAYIRSEFDHYVNADYRSIMQAAIDWLDTHIFIVYPKAWIVFVRPAFYMVLSLLFCFAGYKRHKSKMLLAVAPAVLNTMGYFVIIAAQDVRYFFINYTVAVIAFMYSSMSDKV